MCKTLKNCFYEKLTFDKLIEAHERAKQGKCSKPEVIKFEMDLETNISNTLKHIKNGTYEFGEYRSFIIYELKERKIDALPYKNRIVHQWYVEEFIKPYFCPRFVPTTFACIDKRGTHNAVYRVQKFMRRARRKWNNYYVIKFDIKKYFYSIDRRILFNILKKYISDKKLLEFTKKILGDLDDVGIPIGNYTSQFFANIYLNELDHYIYDILDHKLYVRYMDDFIVLVQTKEEAKEIMKLVEIFLKENLNLCLNQKSRYFPNKLGVNFCGYRIYEDFKLLRKRYKNKLKSNIKFWNKLRKTDKLSIEKSKVRWNSFKAHASHCCSKNYFEKLYDKYNILDLFE